MVAQRIFQAFGFALLALLSGMTRASANVKDKKDPSPFWFNRVPLHPPIVASILRELARV